jgi:hypothetical protein
MALYDQAGTASTGNVTSVVVTPSKGAPPQNSIIILSAMTGGNTASGFTCSGFSGVTGLSTQAPGGDSFLCQPLYKVAGASEPTSYTLSLNAGNWTSAQVTVFTGRNASSPITAVSEMVSSSAISSGGSITIPTLTDAADLAITLTPPASPAFGHVLDTNSGGSFSVGIDSAVAQNIAAGATGSLTGTIAWSGGGTTNYAGFLISVAAASGTATVAWLK